MIHFRRTLSLVLSLAAVAADNDDDIDKLFLQNGSPIKGGKPYFQPGPLSEIFIIANLQHAASGFQPAQNLSSGFVE